MANKPLTVSSSAKAHSLYSLSFTGKRSKQSSILLNFEVNILGKRCSPFVEMSCQSYQTANGCFVFFVFCFTLKCLQGTIPLLLLNSSSLYCNKGDSKELIQNSFFTTAFCQPLGTHTWVTASIQCLSIWTFNPSWNFQYHKDISHTLVRVTIT